MLDTIQDNVFPPHIIIQPLVCERTVKKKKKKVRQSSTDVFILLGSFCMSVSFIQVSPWRRVPASSASSNGTLLILFSCPHWIGPDAAVLFRKLFLMEKWRNGRRWGNMLTGAAGYTTRVVSVHPSVVVVYSIAYYCFYFIHIWIQIGKDELWDLWLKCQSCTVNKEQLSKILKCTIWTIDQILAHIVLYQCCILGNLDIKNYNSNHFVDKVMLMAQYYDENNCL